MKKFTQIKKAAFVSLILTSTVALANQANNDSNYYNQAVADNGVNQGGTQQPAQQIQQAPVSPYQPPSFYYPQSSPSYNAFPDRTEANSIYEQNQHRGQ